MKKFVIDSKEHLDNVILNEYLRNYDRVKGDDELSKKLEELKQETYIAGFYGCLGYLRNNRYLKLKFKDGE